MRIDEFEFQDRNGNEIEPTKNQLVVYIKSLHKQIAELQKQLKGKEEEIQTKNTINNLYKATLSLRDNDFKDLVYENNSLKQQLKSQPAEIVEKIRNLAEKDFDFDTCTCCGEDVHDDVVLPKSDFNKILDKVLKKYGEK